LELVSRFLRSLAARQTSPDRRRWLFVPSDQLSDLIGPLSREDPGDLGVILIESPWKAARRPYHRQRLALVLANLRHFALEQAERGVAVRYLVSRGPYRTALEPLTRELGPIRVMRPAERELRIDLAPLIDDGRLEEIPHEGWLTTDDDFTRSQKGDPPWRMDVFYRHVRKRTGLLMEEERPVGGKMSFDADNRRPWPGSPAAPDPPRFEPDELTVEVVELVEQQYAEHPGTLDPASLPASLEDVRTLWEWALAECLPLFGPFEDAMSHRSTGLFHTRISTLLNIHRLLPSRVIDDVARIDIPLASKEGFIRQVLGWREFVRHVHDATDGFRQLPNRTPEVADWPGDGGWSRWTGRTWPHSESRDDIDGGAAPNHLEADRSLPAAYWGRPSGLSCLDVVVADVWREGWSHHITRLMVLSNLATLLGVSPRELTDWFWIAYVDAFDWVVEPNVLGMGTFGTGPLMTTKPYVSGAAYISRMSDYCDQCAFDPKRDCPITNLYWAFLDRHRDRLADNPRMRVVINALRKRDDGRLEDDRAVLRWVVEAMDRGDVLHPADRPGGGARKRERSR
jgi:deoxyribodipyrimidine photolyase-related protein